MAHVTPCKGLDEDMYTANMIADDILWLGYNSITIKTDNEVSVLALAKKVGERIRVKAGDVIKINKEESARYESQSNGGTETGIMVVRGLYRTLKLCLESRLDTYIQPNHSVMSWLLEHTCMLLNARVRGTDGMTPWQRIRGTPFNQRPFGSGEHVPWNFPRTGKNIT